MADLFLARQCPRRINRNAPLIRQGRLARQFISVTGIGGKPVCLIRQRSNLQGAPSGVGLVDLKAEIEANCSKHEPGFRDRLNLGAAKKLGTVRSLQVC